jgi:hypothetical protein
MACADCKCKTDGPRDKTQEEVNAEKFQELEERVRSIDEFLATKFPDDLVKNGDIMITCKDWSKAQFDERARQFRIRQAIERLEANGYIVAKPEALAAPTLETSIREVVLANTVVK